ncbi:uncharacterized protein [Palaemon carinicauda]|uniref:uncharacterized protein n=1 Tax=Palaemon carinicauda TaxID=392227 RepID=UPI0035B5BA26
MNKGELEKCLKRLKKGKAAGPGGLKPDYYKAMRSDICKNTLVNCYKEELASKEKPQSWKESRTKMLKKKNKPTVKELRPIALTNVSYKIYMAFIKDGIEGHLKSNNAIENSQAGFIEGRRIEDNIFILQYMIIKQVEKEGNGFKNDIIKLVVVFFADDVLVLAESIEDAELNIRNLIDIGKQYGLDINRDKSSVLFYNMKEKPDNIEGIRVVSNIKYLGIKVDDSRNMFKT